MFLRKNALGEMQLLDTLYKLFLTIAKCKKMAK